MIYEYLFEFNCSFSMFQRTIERDRGMFQTADHNAWTPLINVQNPESGFTLLEIMVAIFIFAIVITTIFASYNSLFSGNETIDQSIVSYEMGENCLKQMITDLKSIYVVLPPEYTPPDLGDSHDLYRIVGDAVDIGGTEFPQLRFTSLSHVSFRGKLQHGIAEIVYYVQETDDGHFLLKRADHLYPYPPFEKKASDPILCKDVKALLFRYYDKNGEEYDLWNSDAQGSGYSTPRAVSIRLELISDSQILQFETMVTIPVFREKKG